MVVLSLEDKIDGKKNSESSSKLVAQIYGVGVSTISDIKNSATLMKFTCALIGILLYQIQICFFYVG